jgi:hypothetical protein
MNGVVMLIKVIISVSLLCILQNAFHTVFWYGSAFYSSISQKIFRMLETEKTEKRGAVLQFWAIEKL